MEPQDLLNCLALDVDGKSYSLMHSIYPKYYTTDIQVEVIRHRLEYMVREYPVEYIDNLINEAMNYTQFSVEDFAEKYKLKNAIAREFVINNLRTRNKIVKYREATAYSFLNINEKVDISPLGTDVDWRCQICKGISKQRLVKTSFKPKCPYPHKGIKSLHLILIG